MSACILCLCSSAQSTDLVALRVLGGGCGAGAAGAAGTTGARGLGAVFNLSVVRGPAGPRCSSESVILNLMYEFSRCPIASAPLIDKRTGIGGASHLLNESLRFSPQFLSAPELLEKDRLIEDLRYG
jgi:hypothetical protein